jgi:hypothetical protein
MNCLDFIRYLSLSLFDEVSKKERVYFSFAVHYTCFTQLNQKNILFLFAYFNFSFLLCSV